MTSVPQQPYGVLFDLDGTLLDTAPDMVAALNALLLENDLPAFPFETVRPYVSHGSIRMVRMAFPAASESRFVNLRDRMLALYRERIAAETTFFPGMETLLDRLEQDGVRWGIVTNKPGWLTEALLIELKLDQRAAAVVSGDSLSRRKPHPLPLLYAAERMGVAPERCVYVGDAQRDIEAARSANMFALAARFGYIAPEDRIDEWPAHGWIDAPLDVLHWLEHVR